MGMYMLSLILRQMRQFCLRPIERMVPGGSIAMMLSSCEKAVLLRIPGQVGVDPGSQWAGGGADDTLRRKDSVCAGDTNASDAFDASTEWDVFAQNDASGLGSHTTNCDGSGGGRSTNVIINEVDSDTPGSDAAEFVELYDGGTGNTDSGRSGHRLFEWLGRCFLSYPSI